MNYEQLLERLKGEERIAKGRDRVHAMLAIIHSMVPSAEYEFYGRHGVCIFMKGPKDAIILGVNPTFGEVEAYHPTHGWNVGNGRPDKTLAELIGHVLIGFLGDEDSSWGWNSPTNSPQVFFRTLDHDVYYGETALRAAEAYASDCRIPVCQAFRTLSAFDAQLDGEVLKAPSGVEGRYMGTLVLTDRIASMAARTKPWSSTE